MRRLMAACCAVGLLSACGSSKERLVDAPTSQMLSPFGLTASKGVAGHVRLDWNIPADSQPNSFRIERDGIEIAVVAANRLTYLDTSADPGLVETPRPPVLRPEKDRVAIEWTAPDTREGRSQSYTVIADYGGIDRRSESAVGNRGAPAITGYVIRRDGNLLANLSPNETTYDDDALPPGSIDPPLALTMHPSSGSVALSWGEPAVRPGVSRTYTVEAVSEIGTTAASNGRRAGRAGGEIQGYVIKRDGAPIVSLPASARSYEDTGAMAGALSPSPAFAARAEEDGIRLEWSSATSRQGFEHSYEVTAVTSDAMGMPAFVTGFRSAPTVDAYRLLRDGVLVATLPSTASSFLDTTAASGVLGPPMGLSVAPSIAGSLLTWTAPAGSAGGTYTYELVATSDLGQATASSAVPAARGAPEVAEYIVLRDGFEIARLSPMVTSYEDRGAMSQLDPPVLAIAPSADAVDLSWQPPSSAGSSLHTWQVVAGRKDGQRSAPAVASGSSTAAVTQYIVSRDGVEVAFLPPTALSFHDVGALPGSVDPAVLELRSSVESVTLRWDAPAAHPGPTHDYQLKAVTSVGTSVASSLIPAGRTAPAITGYRIDRDWLPFATLPASQRSYDDTAATAGDATAAELTVASTVDSVGLTWQAAGTSAGQSRTYELYVLVGASAIGSPEVVGGRSSPTVTGYRLLRDGGSIAALGSTSRSFMDDGASPGSVDPVGPVTLNAAVGSIALAWQVPATNPGAAHDYVLETQLDTGAVKTSATKSGRRAAPALSGFRVTRDGSVVATLPATDTTYADTQASAGSFSGSLALAAQPRVDGIRLDWTPPTPQAGSVHAYTVQALAGTMSGPASSPAAGARSAPNITGYTVARDGATIASLPSSATTHDDVGAGAGSADAPATLVATAAVDSIRLVWSPAVVRAGATHAYVVSASTDLGTSLSSASTSGASLAPSVIDYHVHRDGIEIANVNATTLIDTDATPGVVHAPSAVSATQGTRPDGVMVTWVAADADPGQTHVYQVYTDTDLGLTGASPAATAARLAPPVVRYEVSRDGGSWMTAGTGASYDDSGAPYGTVTATATAQPNDVLSFVELDLVAPPAYGAGPASNYEVRALTASGPGPSSAPASGFRGPGPVSGLTFQWQRSAADSDANYTDLAGAIDPASMDSTNPLDQGRYYRLAFTGSGVSGFSAPARAKALSYSSVSAGANHTCGVRSDGSGVCWGNAGDGRTTVPAGLQLLAITAGGRHTCAVRTDRRVQCWGYNSNNQANPPNLDQFRSISAGDIHTCGVRMGRSGLDMVCWGSNSSNRSDPPNLWFRDWSTLVSAGGKHSCGSDDQNHIECWGSSSDNQTRIPNGVSRIVDVAAGDLHTCAVLSGTNQLSCWGSNTYGQTNRPSGSYTRVTAGTRHSCAMTSSGTVTCWGSSADGRLVVPAGTYKAVSAGGDHTCGIHTDGRVDCWGRNTDGQAPHQP